MALLASCTDARDSDSSPSPSPEAGSQLQLSGVSFGGTISIEPHGYVATTPQEPFYREFIHTYVPPSSLVVTLLIPAAVYQGVGTYACGSLLDTLPRDLPYCTIKVTHVVDPGTYAVWGTTGVFDALGSLGPIPGCNVTVAEAGAQVRGSVTCPTLRFQVAQGTHPDAGKWLNIDGGWSFDAP